jgi:hypothetical protein
MFQAFFDKVWSRCQRGEMTQPPSKVRQNTAVVYAILIDEKVRYVGCTRTPKKRRREHERNLGRTDFKMLAIAHEWRVLAFVIETKLIRLYQAHGLADLNGRMRDGKAILAESGEYPEAGRGAK